MITVVTIASVSMGVGWLLIQPSRRRRSPTPHLQAVQLKIPSSSGAMLAAWLLTPPEPRATAVVLHGLRGHSGHMLARARLLRDEGFAVLVPDLQAHGESTGDHITFGYLEARDAEACVSYLRARYRDLPVVAVGVSMGGAAIALAGDRLPLRAAVLEAAYPTIAEAVDNRLRRRVGLLAPLFDPLLLLQIEPRLGITPEDLRPIESVKTIRYPLLIASGNADSETTEAQTKALFAAARVPKELWLVPGAGHVDLLRYDPDGYRQHVLAFLRQHVLQRRVVMTGRP